MIRFHRQIFMVVYIYNQHMFAISIVEDIKNENSPLLSILPLSWTSNTLFDKSWSQALVFAKTISCTCILSRNVKLLSVTINYEIYSVITSISSGKVLYWLLSEYNDTLLWRQIKTPAYMMPTTLQLRIFTVFSLPRFLFTRSTWFTLPANIFRHRHESGYKFLCIHDS